MNKYYTDIECATQNKAVYHYGNILNELSFCPVYRYKFYLIYTDKNTNYLLKQENAKILEDHTVQD